MTQDFVGSIRRALTAHWPDARWTVGWGEAGASIEGRSGGRWVRLPADGSVRIGVDRAADAPLRTEQLLVPATWEIPGRCFTGDVGFDAVVRVPEPAWLGLLDAEARGEVATLVAQGWLVGAGEARLDRYAAEACGTGLVHAVERGLALLARWARRDDTQLVEAWQDDSVPVRTAARQLLESRVEDLEADAVPRLVEQAIAADALYLLEQVPMTHAGVLAWCSGRGPFDERLLWRLQRGAPEEAWAAWMPRAWRVDSARTRSLIDERSPRWSRRDFLEALAADLPEDLSDSFLRWLGELRPALEAGRRAQLAAVLATPWTPVVEEVLSGLSAFREREVGEALVAHLVRAATDLPPEGQRPGLPQPSATLLHQARFASTQAGWSAALLGPAPAWAPFLRPRSVAGQIAQLRALEATGAAADGALQWLLTGSDDPEVRVGAARQLGRVGSGLVVGVLEDTAHRWFAPARLRTACQEAVRAIDARGERGGVSLATSMGGEVAAAPSSDLARGASSDDDGAC